MTGTAGESGPLGVSDAAIRAMLEDRAGRARAVDIDLATVIAAAGRRSSSRGVRWSGVPTWTSLVATAAAAVVIATVLGPMLARPGASAVPSPASSSVASGDGPTGSPLAASPEATTDGGILLTARELGELARTSSTALAGRYAVVRGPIRLSVPDPIVCKSEASQEQSRWPDLRHQYWLRTFVCKSEASLQRAGDWHVNA